MATTYNPDEAPYVELSGPMQQVMAFILQKYGFGLASLRVVGNPDWAINPYKQERMPVWEALDRLVMMIGWDLRWRWLPDSRTTGQLTLCEPSRSVANNVKVLGPTEYFSVERFESSTDDIRNMVVVAFGPAETRAYVVRQNAASISRFRFPRIMWIEEGSDSALQSEAEAVRLAEVALKDLERPRETAVVKMPYCPLFEVGDIVDLQDNGEQVKGQTRYSVTGVRHDFGDGTITTTLTLFQDMPVSSVGAWKSLETRSGVKYW